MSQILAFERKDSAVARIRVSAVPTQAVRYVTALTPREREVLQHVAAGSSNSEIAGNLRISRDGVKYHLKSIFAKLGARSRTDAVRLAREYALIPPQAPAVAARTVVVG